MALGQKNQQKQLFIKSVQEATEKKINPTGIFLDLTKAYDVLNHSFTIKIRLLWH